MNKHWIIWMGLAAALVLVAAGCASPGVPQQAADAETVFRNITVALNEKNVDQAIAWVADDCVLTIVPPPPGGTGVYRGKAQILARFKEVVGVNANHVLSNVKMNGEQVTWQASYTDDTLKPAGLSSLEFTGQALVQGGLAKSITWTLTPASLAKLQAAMAPTPTPLPPLGLEKLVSRPEDLIGVWKVIFIEGAGVGQLEFKQDGTYTLVGVEGNATGAYVDSGKFRVEGKQLKLIPTGGCLTPMGETVNPCIGIYQAYVARRAGQPAQLRLVGVEDPAHDRWRTYNNKTFPVVNTPVK